MGRSPHEECELKLYVIITGVTGITPTKQFLKRKIRAL